MHHDPAQLDALWAALQSGDTAARAELLKHYANQAMPAAHPGILCDDAEVQVLSIPSPDRPRRHVYARRPGSAWIELA